MELAPPTCLECGALMPSRRYKYCAACVREGVPKAQTVGDATKAVIINAARNAIGYWQKEADAPHALQVGRSYALAQVAYFKKKLEELTGGGA